MKIEPHSDLRGADALILAWAALFGACFSTLLLISFFGDRFLNSLCRGLTCWEKNASTTGTNTATHIPDQELTVISAGNAMRSSGMSLNRISATGKNIYAGTGQNKKQSASATNKSTTQEIDMRAAIDWSIAVVCGVLLALAGVHGWTT